VAFVSRAKSLGAFLKGSVFAVHLGADCFGPGQKVFYGLVRAQLGCGTMRM
jgi:hypothetical protein